jgi:DNA-binding helix-hairpin-helix protein with protein kinase domain
VITAGPTEVASGQLAPGSVFTSARGRRHGSVMGLLGVGGQGAVYEVGIGNARFALKWYHDHYVDMDQTLRARLTRAVERGAPNSSFLWPLDIVQRPDSRSFGYIMPLRDPAFATMRGLIARPPHRIELTLEQRMMLCARIADSFLQLHASGFCYQDVNFGNFFVNPRTAEVLICDNDNVNIDGAEASIYGTRKFMAPEVVRRMALPSTTTDLFSMAVLFFYALFGWHPLDGQREAAYQVLDAAAEMLLYGTNPVFLFDPNDPSNGPVPGQHAPLIRRWQSLPAVLRDLFVRSFGVGLHDTRKRVLEYEWRAAFVAAHASIFTCEKCDYAHCAEPHHAFTGAAPTCLRCGEALMVPPLLACGRSTFAAQPGRELPRHCFVATASPDFGVVVARAERHPSAPGVVGLRNQADFEWTATITGRPPTKVPPGKTVRLVPGMQISFGQAHGRVLGGGV